MGGSGSTPSRPSPPPRRRTPSPKVVYVRRTPTPPPQVLTDSRWRRLDDSGLSSSDYEAKLNEDIRKLQPEKKAKVLLIGPVGAGKSSFINSGLSLGVGRKKASAQTGSADKSYTLTFKTYTDNALFKYFRITDCMGIEPGVGKGFNENDIFFLIEGRIKDGYKFNPDKPLAIGDKFYRENPKFENKTHCVVFVVDAITIYNGIPPEYLGKIKRLQYQIKEADIPRALILTKADKLCEKVEEDPANMFRSVKVREAVNKASEVFCIEKASIHPVVNYETESVLSHEQNIPLLLAIRQILQYATDKVEQDLYVDDEDDEDDED